MTMIMMIGVVLVGVGIVKAMNNLYGNSETENNWIVGNRW